MKARPKIPIELTRLDKAIEAACLSLLILLWIGTIAGYSKLPEEIPSHFNAAGEPDGYSNKSSILSLPIVATILYLGMTLINRYPHTYNYPAAITEENARRMYTAATRLIRILKLGVVIIFSCIVFLTYRSVFMNGDGLGAWFLPVVLGLIPGPVIIYFVRILFSKSWIRQTENLTAIGGKCDFCLFHILYFHKNGSF